MTSNWNGSWGQYGTRRRCHHQAIPAETDPDALKAMYTDLVKIYLTDVPSFTLMYRPQSFHTGERERLVNFPEGATAQSARAPLNLTDGLEHCRPLQSGACQPVKK